MLRISLLFVELSFFCCVIAAYSGFEQINRERHLHRSSRSHCFFIPYEIRIGLELKKDI